MLCKSFRFRVEYPRVYRHSAFTLVTRAALPPLRGLNMTHRKEDGKNGAETRIVGRGDPDAPCEKSAQTRKNTGICFGMHQKTPQYASISRRVGVAAPYGLPIVRIFFAIFLWVKLSSAGGELMKTPGFCLIPLPWTCNEYERVSVPIHMQFTPIGQGVTK